MERNCKQVYHCKGRHKYFDSGSKENTAENYLKNRERKRKKRKSNK